ncbi:hypothetical protein [Frigoriglobus tundricola]|uniref:Uncharacterized protein n=1 Tax=Frigoriglobus tundricola TaxID=2774151 RepID=A0A6M5YJ31_9BACT|nr:hypothetical protein [Frigoriglobus tundricola]QJW93273.1 hypothetical protein FTUN_0779 [Frigoriglobus tundricola]
MLGAVLALLGACASHTALAAQDDTAQTRIATARAEYESKVDRYQAAVAKWFDKREGDARTTGDRKAVELVKAERAVYSETGALPNGAPDEVRKQLTTARAEFEAAMALAIKDFIRAKKDEDAAVAEQALLAFRREAWKHLAGPKIVVRDDHLRIEPHGDLSTVRKYTGAVEIVVVARTEAENIRLYAPRGACVIFNWEVNPRELRVCRPDGDDRPESGSITTAKAVPLKANVWHTLKWRLTEEGMQIWADGKLVFEEKKAYDLSGTAPITVHAVKSNVDVKEFRVTTLGKNR